MPPRPSANTTTSSRPSEGAPPSPVTRTHPDYYKEGGDLWFLVPNPTPTYFRVASSFFRDHSLDFFALKTGPEAAPTDPLPGTGGPERAIIIDETDVDGFAMWLWIFYNPLCDDYSLATLEQWFSILRLATLWGFSRVKEMALRYIKTVIDRDIPDLVDRVVKYEDFKAPNETLLPLYVELCSRSEHLTDSEWDKLERLPGRRHRRVADAMFLLANRTMTPSRATDIVRSTLGLQEPPPAASGVQQPQTGPQSNANTSSTGARGGGSGGGSGSNRGGNGDGGGASAGGTTRNSASRGSI